MDYYGEWARVKGKTNVAEMMYMRRCCYKTLSDWERNDRIREIMGVGTSSVQKYWLWYGPMRWNDPETMPQKVTQRRKRGRPCRR